MKILFLILSLSSIMFKQGQGNDKKQIETYLAIAAKKNLDKKALYTFIVPIGDQNDSINKKRYEILDLQLTYQNKLLQNKDLRKITIVPYKSLPASQQNINGTDELTDNIYEIQYNGKRLFTMLLDSRHLIKSMSLASKGEGSPRFFFLI